MSFLRRSALRALSSPSASFSKPRSITTCTPSAFLSRQQRVALPLQRRFASNDSAPPSAATVTDETVTESPSRSEREAQAEHSHSSSSTIDTIKATASDAAHSVSESARSVANSVSGAASSAAGMFGAGRDNQREGPTPPGEPSPTIYVGNLFFEVSEKSLEQEFSRFGPVKNTRIVYDVRGLSKGFGYVEFETVQAAQAAIENMNQQVFEGRRLAVQFHRARGNLRGPDNRQRQMSGPTKTLFIGNMSFEMSDKDLNDLFREIRNVLDVRVAIDRRSGQPRGFAHADFIDVASAEKAMAQLKDKEVYGRRLRVDFSHSSNQNKLP